MWRSECTTISKNSIAAVSLGWDVASVRVRPVNGKRANGELLVMDVVWELNAKIIISLDKNEIQVLYAE